MITLLLVILRVECSLGGKKALLVYFIVRRKRKKKKEKIANRFPRIILFYFRSSIAIVCFCTFFLCETRKNNMQYSAPQNYGMLVHNNRGDCGGHFFFILFK